MKKVLSMTLIAMMMVFATVSCNKEESKTGGDTPVTPPDDPQPTDTITKNPIMEAFNLGKDMLGKTETELIQVLTANGYINNGGVYMYIGESYYVQMTDSVNGENKIYNLALTVVPYDDGEGEYKPMLTIQYAYDAVNKIGSQFNMGSKNLRYWGTYNQVGTRIAANYNEFVKYVNEGNFDKNNSIWLDSSIQHYDADNWNGFIGLQLHSSKYAVQGSNVVEFSFPINFIDNSLK